VEEFEQKIVKMKICRWNDHVDRGLKKAYSFFMWCDWNY